MSLLIPIASLGTRIKPKVYHVDVSLWKILLFTPGSCQVKCFYDRTLYSQTVHSCRGLMPKNRNTSSQPCFFRVSFWVNWSPSVSIPISQTSFYVISLRCRTGNFESATSTASPSTCVAESSVVASIQFQTHVAPEQEGNFPSLRR